MKEKWISSNTLFAIGLAFFLVLTHWGFWDIGVHALGWNTSLFWVVFLGYLYHQAPKLRHRSSIWIPLLLMALSFAIYENPWLKFVTMGVLPITTGIFYLYGQMENVKKRWWGWNFLGQMGHHFLQPIMKVEQSVVQIFNEIFRAQHSKRARSIFAGLGILLLLLLVVVLPLLGSADAVFAEKISLISDFFAELFEGNLVARLLFFALSSVLILAVFMGWIHEIKLKDEPELKNHDDWISGIVLGGLLGTYALFLWVQISHLFVGTLPLDLESTIQFVKSGFWQLFSLSLLNGLLFFTYYRRTSNIPQIILKVFIVASGLLLLSAGWRMWLYVTVHGFSYEKFFAAYTTLFSFVVFIMLVMASFTTHKMNIFKIFSFMAFWAFALVTVFPVEQFILQTNMILRGQEGSKVEMHELRMLSADVYQTVLEHHESWEEEEFVAWEQWFDDIKNDYYERAWYESNWSFELNRPKVEQ